MTLVYHCGGKENVWSTGINTDVDLLEICTSAALMEGFTVSLDIWCLFQKAVG